MTNEIVVFAEQKSDSLTTSAKGAFSAAKEVAESKSIPISAVIAGKVGISSSIKQCFSLGASKVYIFKHDELEFYRSLPYTRIFSQLIEDYSPEVIIFGYSTSTTDLAPRVAYLKNVASVTGVTKFDWDGEKLIALKPAFNERLEIKYGLSGNLKVAVIGIGAYSSPESAEGATGEEIICKANFQNGDLNEEILGVEVVEKTVDLSESKFILSGGRGVGSSEKFKIIYETASKLGAQPASSRAVWDAGWTDSDIHVGQTGGSVSPDVYIACGISGAIQHVAGIKKSKTIIVVNTDPDAPIWEVGSYGIVGDLHKVLPLLAEKFS